MTCNYTGDGADELHLPGEGAFVFSTTPHSHGPGLGPNVPKDSLSPEGHDDQVEKMLGIPLDLHQTEEPYRLTKDDLDILRIFKNRTVYTIGTAQSVATYRNELVNLCFSVSICKSMNMPYSLLTSPSRPPT